MLVTAMPCLSDRILECLRAGAPVARADLVPGANYDSAGRALGALVRARKIVRVGRGRYQLAGAGSAVAAATIGEAIARRIRRSRRNVFLRADFEAMGSYDAVGRALRRLIDGGSLVQIGYGLYAKAAVSPFSGKPAPVVGIRRLATEALARLGKSVAASGFDQAYASGRSTQIPTGRALAVKGRVRRRIGYDGHYVVLESA
jgi:hypothetical protein